MEGNPGGHARSLRKFEIILACQRCDFIYFGGKKRPKKELFVIIKLDVASSAVSPFSIFFMKRRSLQVFTDICYMSAHLNNIRLYSQWNSAVLLRTDVIWHTSNLIIPSTWKPLLFKCYITVHHDCMGMWHLVVPPFQLWLIMWCPCYMCAMRSADDQIILDIWPILLEFNLPRRLS